VGVTLAVLEGVAVGRLEVVEVADAVAIGVLVTVEVGTGVTRLIGI